MFCPQCGQERISNDTNYCSRCGFLLTGTTELLMTGGVNPHLPAKTGLRAASPRNRGLKQGLFIFLLTFLIVPIITMITIARGAEPFAVVISAILLSVGGILRMVYALMFESNEPGGQTIEQTAFAAAQNVLGRQPTAGALPAQQTYPAAAYVSPATGNWRNTNELEPASVTDSTTKLLEREAADQ